MNAINAQSIADYLVDLIEQDDQPWSDDGDKPTVRSFEDAGVMTRNAGLVLRAPTGRSSKLASSSPAETRQPRMAHRSGEQLIHTVLVVNQDQIGWRNLSLAFFLQESGYNARP